MSKLEFNVLVNLDERRVFENYCVRVDRVNKTYLGICSIAGLIIALKAIVFWIALSVREFPVKVS
jgi:hypothetical protein